MTESQPALVASPTPWTTSVFAPSNATAIYDATGALVETVYGREGDPLGEALARRIVDAVNREAQ